MVSWPAMVIWSWEVVNASVLVVTLYVAVCIPVLVIGMVSGS